MDHRPPAPGGLALVEAFLRTRNSVTSPATLARWMREHGFPAGQLTASDLATAVEAREAIRALAGANTPGGPPPAPGAVNGLLRTHAVAPELSPSLQLRWRAPGDGLGALLGAVLGGVVTAVADGTWARFKTCAAGDCGYAFYDHTRNRSARWCDVAGCGVNTRMRAYRTRRGAL